MRRVFSMEEARRIRQGIMEKNAKRRDYYARKKGSVGRTTKGTAGGNGG